MHNLSCSHCNISNIMHNVLMTIKIDTCNALAKAEKPKPEILNSLVQPRPESSPIMFQCPEDDVISRSYLPRVVLTCESRWW